MKNGGSLTINPDTGLPEAGFLDKLLPTIIGAGLSFIPGVGPLLAAGIVGGIQTVRTGDLGKGLAAGLGAYGGAGLAQGLATAGGNILSGEATSLAAQQAGNLAGEQATQMGLSDLAKQQMIDEAGSATARVATDASPFAKLSAGVDAAKANPMQFANKDNFKYLAAAAGPILADQAIKSNMPTTVTQPGMIRPYSFDPYGGTYTAGTPYETAPTKAAGGGLMGMANERFNFARSGGPVVGMNNGGLSAGAQYAAANNVDVGANVNKFIEDNPFATAADINAALTKAGMTQEDVNPFLTANTNISDATRYALSHAGEMPGAGGLAGMQAGILKGLATPNLTQAQIDAEQKKYGISDADIQAPFAHGYQVDPNQTAAAQQYLAANKDVAAYLSSEEGRNYLKQHPEFDASDIAYTHYMRYGKNEGRQFGTPSVVPGDVRLDTATTYDNGSFGNYGSGNQTGVDYKGNTVSIATPGDILTNPDNSRTMTPNIPGRPYGGFTGVDELKSAYTAGGGSLGYTPTAPKTIDEFNASFNKLTGGSKAAYDYLMGKTPYSPIPYTPTGEIQKPYWESVGRFPAQEKNKNKKYIYNGSTYVLNPDYVKPSYVLAAEKAAAGKETTKTDAAAGKSINVLDAQGNTEQAYLRDDGFYYSSGGTKFDEKGAQVVAGGGLMAMARGGMSQFDLGGYSDGGRLLRGPGDGVSDSIPATIGNKRPARLADGEFVVPARIVSELGNGSTEAGARKLYAMMDRIQKARRGTVGRGRVAKNSRSEKYLPA
jgi:hypothetical protein